MCFAHPKWGSCLLVFQNLWRIAWSQQNFLCYCRLWVQPCVLPSVAPIPFFTLQIIAILPFFLSFFSIPLTLFLLYRIKLQFCVYLNRLYSCDSVMTVHAIYCLCIPLLWVLGGALGALYTLHREVVGIERCGFFGTLYPIQRNHTQGCLHVLKGL